MCVCVWKKMKFGDDKLASRSIVPSATLCGCTDRHKKTKLGCKKIPPRVIVSLYD